MNSWHFWTDLDFRTSDFQSATPSPKYKDDIFGQILMSGFQIFKASQSWPFWTDRDIRISDFQSAISDKQLLLDKTLHVYVTCH